MPVTVVVGGQFGSEGKGKLAHWVATTSGAAAAVRVGGPNSGHTALDREGRPHVFFHLPTAALLNGVQCFLAAGSYVEPRRFLTEVEALGLPPERVCVDSKATVIMEKDIEVERASTLRGTISSTLSGTGAAVAGRIARDARRRLAESCDELAPFLGDAGNSIRRLLERGERVVLEGTQGFGLSLLHSPHYPYVTSRDTTAAAVVAEVGLSPLDVDDVVLVLRAFPIRVEGNSGPLPDEITWETLTAESGSRDPLLEHTSVTGRVRRVARFHEDVVLRAIQANRPTRVALNHLDYVDARCRDSTTISERVQQFLARVEAVLNRRVDLCGLGPGVLIPRTYSRDSRVA